MPLRGKAQLKIPKFTFGVSYRVDEKNISFRDAYNCLLNGGRLEKRNAIRPIS